MFAIHRYCDAHLPFINDYPVLKVTFADGVRDVVLEYVDATINISFSPMLAIH